MTRFSGTLDPEHDFLSAVENERTEQIPALDEHGWVRPARSQPVGSKPAHSAQPPVGNAAHSGNPAHSPDTAHSAETGHSADAPRSRSAGHSSFEKTHPRLSTRAQRAYGRHAAVSAGTPAEGFPRSVSWNGRIGTVRKEVPPNQDVEFGDSFTGPAAGLIDPSEDPAAAPAFDQADGIVALWQGALGRMSASATDELPIETPTEEMTVESLAEIPVEASTASPVASPTPDADARESSPAAPGNDSADAGLLAPDMGGGLVAPDSVDLASGELPSTNSRRHAVPDAVLSAALAAPARPPRPKSEVLPMRLPGDHQEPVDELPDVSRGVPLTLDRGSGVPGVHAPLPGLEDLAALEQQVSAPLSHITRALDGESESLDTVVTRELPFSGLPGFTDAPLGSSVVLRQIDELAAVVPEQDRVVENPFRLDGAQAIGGMSLPLLDGGWSRFQPAAGPMFGSAARGQDSQATDVLPTVGAA